MPGMLPATCSGGMPVPPIGCCGMTMGALVRVRVRVRVRARARARVRVRVSLTLTLT